LREDVEGRRKKEGMRGGDEKCRKEGEDKKEHETELQEYGM
jgi:hypothetical protein